MPRIPDAELAHLKRDIPIALLAAAKGIVLKPSGNNLIGLCPFHDDHEPSLSIDPDQNLWHCLGACQQGGSVIDWVMKSESVSFRHAVELLRARETGDGRPRTGDRGRSPHRRPRTRASSNAHGSPNSACRCRLRPTPNTGPMW